MLVAQSLANLLVIVPVGTGGAVPQHVDGIPSPSPADKHRGEEVGRRSQLRENGHQNLVGQAVNRRPTRIVDSHILEVGEANRRLRIVVVVEEIGLFVIGGGGRVGGR